MRDHTFTYIASRVSTPRPHCSMSSTSSKEDTSMTERHQRIAGIVASASIMVPMQSIKDGRIKWLLSKLPQLQSPCDNRIKAFTLFPNLPPELRSFIWKICSSEPRTINLVLPRGISLDKARVENSDEHPAVLQVCQESREEGLRYYSRCLEEGSDASFFSEARILQAPGKVRKALFVNFKVDCFRVWHNLWEDPFFGKHFKLPLKGEDLVENFQIQFGKAGFASPPNLWERVLINDLQKLKSLKSVTATLSSQDRIQSTSPLEEDILQQSWERRYFHEIQQEILRNLPRGWIRFERFQDDAGSRIEVLEEEVTAWEKSMGKGGEHDALDTI